jgi:hypothetical protein
VAPVLLCPECGTKHPLAGVGSRSAFPCSGCGRTLKVPAVAYAAADMRLPSVPPPPVDDLPWPVASPSARTLDPHATQAFSTLSVPPDVPISGVEPLVPSLAPPEVSTAAVSPSVPVGGGGVSDLIPPRPIRLLFWFVAVPVAFVVVFALARTVGLLTSNEVTDVALAEGWSRLWPIVRLVAFVAHAAAGIVQGSIYGVARLRANRRQGPVSADADPGEHRPARQPSRNGA